MLNNQVSTSTMPELTAYICGGARRYWISALSHRISPPLAYWTFAIRRSHRTPWFPEQQNELERRFCEPFSHGSPLLAGRVVAVFSTDFISFSESLLHRRMHFLGDLGDLAAVDVE